MDHSKEGKKTMSQAKKYKRAGQIVR